MVKTFDPKTHIEIDYNKNNRLTDFSKTMLKDFYLKDNEDPQEGFARAARAWCNNDLELAQRIYDGVSNGHFMYASPVLSNSPLPNEKIKGLPISCFAAGTSVNMIDGYIKNIEDIVIGDKVLSHDGSYNEVIAIDSKESSDIYEIEIGSEVFTVTGNHLFLTKDHGWVRVDELDETVHELVSIN